MSKRFVTIWFCHLKADWFCRQHPSFLHTPFVLASPDHGRMLVTAANEEAQKLGIDTGIAVADARAIFPGLQVFDDNQKFSVRLLNSFANYCIRFTPVVAIDPPNGLILDVTGCPHLWGGEISYINEIIKRFKTFGYEVKAAVADTIGAAWAITHFGKNEIIVKTRNQKFALLDLPPVALRLEEDTLERLYKLGLRRIRDFIAMPSSVLRRRFGNHFIQRLEQALGYEDEIIHPVQLPEPYLERLPCMEPIVTATGIEIALKRLLEMLCQRLQSEQKGVRSACFKCYCVDGKVEKLEIGTNHGSNNRNHLFKLFELSISTIEPALGIDLFTLQASKTEDLSTKQEKLWAGNCDLRNIEFFELIDRVSNKIGAQNIHRYLPAEHYWPERSFKLATSFHEQLNTNWKSDKLRPIQLLSRPERIEVTAPIPDYPPMLFRYKNKLHKIKKADGPERIEREWWIEEGSHRDYYCVEDEEGYRYWLFRSGHYSADKKYEWFIHGFFA